MKSPLQLLKMSRPLILSLSLLGGAALTGCASPGRTILAPIPVAPEWKEDCPEAVQPADPVTASAALSFGSDAAAEAQCWKVIAEGAIAAMERHNEAAAENRR